MMDFVTLKFNSLSFGHLVVPAELRGVCEQLRLLSFPFYHLFGVMYDIILSSAHARCND